MADGLRCDLRSPQPLACASTVYVRDRHLRDEGKLQNQGNYLRGKILSIEFDRTSRLVLATGASGAVVVADAARGMLVSVLDGPRSVVMVAHFDPNVQRVVGASWDGTVRV